MSGIRRGQQIGDLERQRVSSRPMAGTFAMDLTGRLRNVPLAPYRALLPVFEAIANSLDAVRERGTPGHIEVDVVRGGGQLELGDELYSTREQIRGFSIRDDGIGFTDSNFESFCTADSQQKVKLGGRGV